jgi:hypothetical protein
VTTEPGEVVRVAWAIRGAQSTTMTNAQRLTPEPLPAAFSGWEELYQIPQGTAASIPKIRLMEKSKAAVHRRLANVV